jgi:translation initiation factor 2 beta subunit (eIF-2beta)/eIF-5
MATANIDRRIDDIFYRYTMPKLAIQNLGTQTVLINISEVGQALRRSPSCM